MAKKRISLSIFHKLLITLLAVSVIPLLALWAVGSTQVQKDVAAQIANKLVLTSAGIAGGITSWDDTNVRVLRTANGIDEITGMDPVKQKPILRAFGAVYEWAFVIYTMDENGVGLARSDDKPNVQYADRTYFKSAMRGEPINRQVVISRTTGKPALTLAVPIRNPLGQPTGVLAMAMKLDDVAKVIKDTKIGKTGYALLLDEEKKLIATGVPGQTGTAVQDVSNHPSLKVDGITEAPTVYTRADGKKVVAFVNKLAQGWTLIVEQDYAEAYSSLEVLERSARILIGITCALVIVVAFVLGKALTRPINVLIAVTEQLSKGQFQDAIPGTGRGDEIGALARAIDRLGVSIRMAMDRLRKKA